MAPFILIGTLLTHLFGGSAGREGTAVQMGASLADQVSAFFSLPAKDRKALLAAGAGAGFGAAIGAPIAGFIFGMEFFTKGKPRSFAWPECLIASLTGYLVTLVLGAPHTVYPKFEIPLVSANLIFSLALCSSAFGVAAYLFVKSTRQVERIFKRFIKYPPVRPLVGGFIVVTLFYLEGTFRFVGLGLSEIQQALTVVAPIDMPFLKSLFTSLTIGSGFKGGEFIPLVFIGSTLGSALSAFLPVSQSLMAALGFSSVFGAASKTPMACAFMCMEIFGFEIGLYALLSGYISFFVCGAPSIYDGQK